MTFKPWDVVVVPFPFVDKAASKPRPALVLSEINFNQKGLVVLTMITTAKKLSHLFDMAISDLAAAGLSNASVVRMKIFTLDTPIIKKRIGNLSKKDKTECRKILKTILPV